MNRDPYFRDENNTSKYQHNHNPVMNDSGMGIRSILPPEIKGWNWGAFLLNWIWGIRNSVWIALLMFVPPITLIMPFILGANGNKWAWCNREWKSVEEFKREQRLWANRGVGFFASLFAISFVTLPIFLSFSERVIWHESMTDLRTNTNPY